MRTYTIIDNERGGITALVSVVVLSLVMVSTLTSFYIYLENRAKYQNRLRMNYQLSYVMDDLGRAILEAREAATTIPPSCSPSDLRYIDCTQVCMQDTAGLSVPAGTPSRAVCVKVDGLNRIVNGADYFCAFNNEPGQGANKPTYCNSITKNDHRDLEESVAIAFKSDTKFNPKHRMQNWYSRLDKFFDTTLVKNAPAIAGKMQPMLEAKLQAPTVLGWILPEVAFAANPDAGGGKNGGSGSTTGTTGTTGNTSTGGTTGTTGTTGTYGTGGTTGTTGTTGTYGTGGTTGTTGTTGISGTTGTTGSTGTQTSDCALNPEATTCVSECAAENRPAFCKNVDATIRMGLVGGSVFTGVEGVGGCSGLTGPTLAAQPRCKRCDGNARNLGQCMKVSICPPWMNDLQCTGEGHGQNARDNRIHQMIRFN